MDNEAFEKLKRDFSWVEDDKSILAVLLFGSKVSEEDHSRSDVDLAIVVPGSSNFYYDCEGVSDEKADSSEVLGKVFREVNTASKDYDVHVFEELPLHIQIDIIHEHQIVYTSDKYGMYEYFYNYRQLWKDQKHRNEMSKEEILSSL